MDALVTDAELRKLTGSELANGDKFLVSLGNCTDASADQLSMDRVAEYEKQLDGVGERVLIRVKKNKSGSNEVGVTALQDNFTLSLVHTSKAGEADRAPPTALLGKALKRL